MEKAALKQTILELKQRLGVTIAAHYYQRDEVVEIADIVGDSLELARKSAVDTNPYLVFCGVGFMGQSVKILAPEKRVFMPRIACCSMARMIDADYFDASVETMIKAGIPRENILPVTYINSSAEVKAKVGQMGGLVCTSANAKTILTQALQSGKKILFVPDRCLGQNLAEQMGLKSAVIGQDADLAHADVICYDGFCSVHQLFTPADIDFYRAKYPGILIAVHPECDPAVVRKADFVGSTSQIINWVKTQPIDQKLAIGTEFNLVNRLREKNTYVLSSTKPECPTMNETTLEEVLTVLRGIENGSFINEMTLDDETRHWAKVALDRMLAL
ncbi:MAG: quinolinate synthase NadA [Campylobacterales bacterium]